MASKVLIVEDEALIRNLLESWLEEADYQTRTACNGREGLRQIYEFRPDVVVVDILMPEMDGFELCRLTRDVCNAGILVLSGLGSEAEKVKGLNMGADDYVVKPVGMDEFLARVAAILRRRSLDGNEFSEAKRYVDGVVTIDCDRHEVWVKENKIQLTPTEFKLLSYLTERAGKTCTIRSILESVWDSPHYSNEVVKWHIASLRSKI